MSFRSFTTRKQQKPRIETSSREHRGPARQQQQQGRDHRGQGGTPPLCSLYPPKRGCADRPHLSGHLSTLPAVVPLPGVPRSLDAPVTEGDAQQHRAGGRRGSSYTTRKNSFQRP